MLLSTDQGADALCVASYLRHTDSNVSIICYWSHGASNDFYDGLKDVNLFSCWILFLIPLTVEHGPFQDDMRLNQVRECWSHAVKYVKPQVASLRRPGT